MFENTVHVTDISSQRFQGWFGHCTLCMEGALELRLQSN